MHATEYDSAEIMIQIMFKPSFIDETETTTS